MSLGNLFKRKARRAAVPVKWVSRFRLGLEFRQRRLAGWLSRKTQYWSKGSWLVALGLFVALFGGCCLWLILKMIL